MKSVILMLVRVSLAFPHLGNQLNLVFENAIGFDAISAIFVPPIVMGTASQAGLASFR